MLKSMPPKDLVEAIRQVHAGKKRSHQALRPISRSTTATRLSPRGKSKSCSRSLAAIATATLAKDFHLRGNGQGSHQAHYGQARGQ